MKFIPRLLPGALVAFLFGLSAIASAQMNYQGRLTGPTGTARDAGPTKLTFSIYNAAGTKIWGDYVMDGLGGNGHGPKADIIADGRFNVIIGATDTSTDTMADAIAAAGTDAIFLEIKVENEASISPRQQILSTPRALFADEAATIPNVTPTTAGNIGIGTTPDSKLHVNGSGAAPALKVAVNGSSKMVVNQNGGVSVGNGNTPPSNGLLVAGNLTATGGLTATGDLTATGNVGIGTNSPTRGKLQVMGGPDSLSGNYGYLRIGFAYSGGASLAAGAHDISIYAENAVEATHILLRSDERIKHIDGRSDQTDDLATLRAIEVTDYSFIDTVGKGNRKQKKVIAQQVEKVFPLAVSKSIDEIPDIYQKATIADGWIMLSTDLKVGERVRLIGEKEKSICPVVEVEEKRFRVANFVLEGDEVFVFGREVDDFRTVDYDAISMLNVSATQELARRLEAELATKTAEIAALKERLEGFDQKFAKLESLLGDESTAKLISFQE